MGGCSFYMLSIYQEQRYCKGVAGNPAPKGLFNYYGHMSMEFQKNDSILALIILNDKTRVRKYDDKRHKCV